MSAVVETPPQSMTVRQFLAWADQQPGRWELVAGNPIRMARETARHNDVKYLAWLALRNAIAQAGVPCYVKGDGIAVEVGEDGWYLPDVSVGCGDVIAPDATTIERPVILVEVSSRSTGNIDGSTKFIDYASVGSLAHYLIISPTSRLVLHHRRLDSTTFSTRFLSDGQLVLDPPGITVQVEDLFPPP
jgi:Uma2 family endonuclease